MVGIRGRKRKLSLQWARARACRCAIDSETAERVPARGFQGVVTVPLPHPEVVQESTIRVRDLRPSLAATVTAATRARLRVGSRDCPSPALHYPGLQWPPVSCAQSLGAWTAPDPLPWRVRGRSARTATHAARIRLSPCGDARDDRLKRAWPSRAPPPAGGPATWGRLGVGGLARADAAVGRLSGVGSGPIGPAGRRPCSLRALSLPAAGGLWAGSGGASDSPRSFVFGFCTYFFLQVTCDHSGWQAEI